MGALNIHGTYNVPHVLCAKYEAKNSDGTAPRIVGLWKDTSFENYIGIEDTTYSNATDFKASVAGVILQYELATSYTEKVEKNHYATYNQTFILEHNKSEAERSANVFNIDDINPNKTPYVEKISDTEFKTTWAAYVLFKTNFKENTQYTISGYTKEDNATHGGRLKIFYTDNTSEECLINYQTSYVYRTHTSQANKTINYIGYSYETGDYYSYYRNLMINEGTTALPYQAYNQNKHITNNEAEFLKTESGRSANLWKNGIINASSNNQTWASVFSNLELKGHTTYTLTYVFSNTGNAINYLSINDGSKDIATTNNGRVTFTTGNAGTYDFYYHASRAEATTGTSTYKNIMLNEGTTPLPYQPYEGKVVHEKDLDNYVTTDTSQEISNTKYFTKGLKVSGRYHEQGDDEGVIVAPDSNGNAVVCLGFATWKRSALIFYTDSSSSDAFWRFNDGVGSNCDIFHPKKSGTIALTSDFKTINGNSIVGSGDMAITADSVFTEVTDVIDTFTINRNGTWLITCLGYNKIYASDNSSIFFYGSALVSMTSAGSDPHICINGTAYACSSAITFITSGIMQVYKKAN